MNVAHPAAYLLFLHVRSSRNGAQKHAVSKLMVIVIEVTDRCRGNGGLYCSAWRVGGVTVYCDVGSGRRQQQGEGKIH
jgi:hypothetical protein